MRILAVSDTIVDQLYSARVARWLPSIDLVIGCGDVPYFYLEFLVSALNSTLVYVRGNHDGNLQYTSTGRVLSKPQGGTDLHGRAQMVSGFLMAGLEGSMRYKPKTPLLYSESEMTLAALGLSLPLTRKIVRYRRPLDILVTHSPPFEIHDDKDLAHRGFKVFLPLLRVFKPRLHLHGHVHVYRNDVPRISQFYDTTIVNVYPYRILDIDKDEIKVT